MVQTFFKEAIKKFGALDALHCIVSMSFHSIITEENIPQLVRCKGRARHEMSHTTDCLLQAFSLVSHPGTRWVFTINVYPYFAPNNALDPGTTDQCSASLDTDWCFKKGCNLPDTVALMRKKTTTLGVRCCRQNPIAKQSLWRNNNFSILLSQKLKDCQDLFVEVNPCNVTCYDDSSKGCSLEETALFGLAKLAGPLHRPALCSHKIEVKTCNNM